MKKNKLVCVVIDYTSGLSQMNCFQKDDQAEAFIGMSKNATNIKSIKKMYFDAIYPIINYAE